MSMDKTSNRVRTILDRVRKAMLLDEWLAKELVNAGYSSVKVISVPREGIGTKITIYASRPSLVIGRRGSRVRELVKKIEEVFGYKNVNITVQEVEEPELDPRIMAWQIERQIARGTRIRRIGLWAINVIRNAGAHAAEIVVSGKLKTTRAAYQKFKFGDILKSGELAERLVSSAKRPVLTKYGIIGVKVSIMKYGLKEYLESISSDEEVGGDEESGGVEREG